MFEDGARGAAPVGRRRRGGDLRVYLERHEPASGVLDRDAGEALPDLAAAVEALADV